MNHDIQSTVYNSHHPFSTSSLDVADIDASKDVCGYKT